MKYFPLLLAFPLLAQNAEKERALGDALAAESRTQTKPVANHQIEQYVELVGRRLVAPLGDEAAGYRFEAILDPSRIEPFGLPGGMIFVPVAALTAANEEAEFVGMLAHAIGHVVDRKRNTPAPPNNTSKTSIPLVFVGGWCAGHTDPRSARLLVPMGMLAVQRTAEIEADRLAVQLSAAAGYDAVAFRRYVERVHTAGSPASALPPREVRLARIDETIASLTVPTARTENVEEFQRAQQAAKSLTDTPERKPPTLKR